MGSCGILPITPLALSLNYSRSTSPPCLSFSHSFIPFAPLPTLSLSRLNSSKASSPIKSKKKDINNDMGKHSKLPHWLASQHRLPLLMLPDKEHSESHQFFSLSENKLYDIQIPEFQGKWCCGSSKGWVVTVDDRSNIHLLNPLSKTQIQLPSLDKFTYPQMSDEPEIPRDYRYMRKIILSADPISTPNYIVVTFVTNDSLFSFYKPGDEGWTTVENQWGPYEDAIYYKGQFYCITNWGYVVACDFTSYGFPKFRKVCNDESGGGNREYIVEASGELLKVFRRYEYHPKYIRYLEKERDKSPNEDIDLESLKWTTRTSYFEVFKLNQKTKEWIQVRSLGKHVLFLGLNCSFSLSDRELKGNRIYFTDDNLSNDARGIDNGIYNLETESTEPCYPNSLSWIPKPMWLHPNL
ncbi:F-box protein SKIP23-like [Tasmannia lanceolata]|uniref:F-box protein SKIP23-like n=1 Tax=Tasmannia lanceolata TaxID=3420 RepID=UPI004063384A